MIPGDSTTWGGILLVLLIALPVLATPAAAGTDIWSSTGPLTTGSGDQVIYALAIGPDNTLYAGTGGGRIWSYTMTFLIPPTKTTTPAPTVTVTGTSSGSDTSGGSTSNSDTGSPTISQGSGTADVNVGGSSPVTRTTVTGTGLDDLVVTGIASDNPGTNLPHPPGRIVYTYLLITPLHYDTITGATIMFTIPQSWLDENQVLPEEITLYHYAGGKWVALQTTVLKTANGQVYFSATTPGFSWFAIGVSKNPTAAATQISTHTSGDIISTATPRVTVHSQASAPQPTGTTDPPVPVPADPGFPFATSAPTGALIGAGCIVLVGSGWYVRRWWIRRQNPALFSECD